MKYMSLDSSCNIANRIEVGFTATMISAAILAYLNNCWWELAGSEPASSINIHVCKSYCLNEFSAAAKGHYRAEPSAVPILMCIFEKMIACERMEQLEYYTLELLTVCGSRTITTDVERVLAKPVQQAPAHIATSSFNFYVGSLPRAGPDDPLCATTYFGWHFKKHLDMIEISGSSGSTPNSFYNPQFAARLCAHVLPYLPILTNIMAPVRERSRPIFPPIPAKGKIGNLN